SFLAGQLRTHSSYQEVFFRSNLIFSYYRNAAPLAIHESQKFYKGYRQENADTTLRKFRY
ncbi:hypothetical protein ACIQYG_21000, partial [Peribacillus sp. NPDC096622]|uniref:hypothetical protein n=1 Tax=Peribacillus sp. NPDC096622 TaxID=3364396 RepID=UPI0038101398